MLTKTTYYLAMFTDIYYIIFYSYLLGIVVLDAGNKGILCKSIFAILF